MFLKPKHIDMLYEMCDIHYECFKKYYSEYQIEYKDVLELNHKKMLGIIKNFDDKKSTSIFLGMIEDYKKMLNKKI
jgi:hypothetical protein